MLEKIREMVNEQTGIDAEKITLEANFKEDLEIDSLDMFELVMSMEDEFGISIPTEELEALTTVQKLITYLEAHK